MGKDFWESYFDAVRNQNWEKALGSLNSILKKEPCNPQIHLKIGDVLQKSGDTSGAIKAYHQSAGFLIRDGFLQKALAVYKVILRIDHNDSEAMTKTKQIMADLDNKKMRIEKGIAEYQEEVEEQVAESTVSSAVAGYADVSEEKIEPSVEPPCHEPTSESSADETGFQEEPSQEFQIDIVPETGLRIPLFLESLPLEDWEHLIAKSLTKTFSSGEIIIKEGELGDSIFVIKSGTAMVSINILNRNIELASLKSGDVFGEVAFLTGRPRTASVTAIDNIEVMEFNHDLLEDILSRFPESLRQLEDFYQYHFQDTLEKVKRKIKE
jgi:tetratricopeptide (TPR) repeat protein